MIDAGPPSRDEDWRVLDASLRPFVARRVAAEDTDDVLQEVYLRLHRSASSLEDDQRFGAWVVRIARNAIVDHHRVRSRHPVVGEVLGEPPQEEMAELPEDSEAESVLAAYAATRVAALPEPYREALTLTELEGLSQKEAAARLGISYSAMKSRVQRGRQQVREAVERCCEVAVDARGHVIDYAPRDSRGCSC